MTAKQAPAKTPDITEDRTLEVIIDELLIGELLKRIAYLEDIVSAILNSESLTRYPIVNDDENGPR